MSDSDPLPSPVPHVLIVEDDVAIQEVLTDLLTDDGYTVMTVANGDEALRLLTKQQVDLILLDLHMPKLDGESFCRLYREQGGNTPIILSTAIDRSQAEEAVRACGAAGYISKPFDLEHVIETVAQHVPVRD